MEKKRKGGTSKISADLKPVLREIGRGQKGVHPEIWARWAEIVGQDLARRMVPLSLEKGRLLVAVAGSTWMQQLTYLKPALMEKFAQEVGQNTVKEIRLVVDYGVFNNQKPK